MSRKIDLFHLYIESVPDVAPSDQADLYRTIVNNILVHAGPKVEELLGVFIEKIIREDVNLSISSEILTYITYVILSDFPDVKSKLLAKTVLTQIQSKSDAFTQQITELRQFLATILEKEKNWKEAAEVLIGLDLESSPNKYSPDYKMETYINITKLYLEDGQPLIANNYIKQAARYNIQTDKELLKVNFKRTYAQLLDCQHKFIEAAQQYYELSVNIFLTHDTCFSFFEDSFECTLMSSIGEPRLRMLSLLYNDKRSENLAQFSILATLYNNRVISPRDIPRIQATLQPHHQNAKTTDGESIFHKATMEHNVFGISKLYKTLFTGSIDSSLVLITVKQKGL